MEFENMIDTAKKIAGDAAVRAKDIGAKSAQIAARGIQEANETAVRMQHEAQLARYNPIFPQEYLDPEFDLPMMIVLVDEDERKGIDVCEGSIGWLSTKGKMEVLHLYLEAVPLSGLEFYPLSVCDAVYFYDPFNRKRFISLSSYFETAQKDKLTELLNIAHMLGAKECIIESFEMEKRVSRKKLGAGVKANGNQGDFDMSSDASSSARRTIEMAHKFEGSDMPIMPELNWYKNDKGIQSLIAMRLSNQSGNAIKEHTLTIDCSASCTMSITMGGKIDATLNRIGAKANLSFEGSAQDESRKRLVYKVLF